jgi:predicted neuraminidase
MLAFWWAGTRESGADVRVFASRWKAGEWSQPRVVVEREALSAELGFAVRRLGNPAAWVAPDGRVHLYVVATGLGGWAASRIVQLVSNDEGGRFAVKRVLPMSPLFNTSVLVRTSPVGLADGGWLLPAYFELGNKYPLLMSFDGTGAPRWLSRIGSLTTALQPALLAVSGREMRALMRDVGSQRKVQQAISRDSGETWADLPASELANHDSSVAALRLNEGGFVMLHNDKLPAGGSPRQWLRLSTSHDAQDWVAAGDVLLGLPGDEFSYPSVQQLGRQLHVTFTSQRKAIAHHVYDIDYAEPQFQ